MLGIWDWPGPVTCEKANIFLANNYDSQKNHHNRRVTIGQARQRTLVFFGNFGLKTQIGNQQVLGKNWV